MSAPSHRTPFALRVWRAALLHADTYEEVEADRSSIRQALVVVLVACFAALIGGWVRASEGTLLMDDRLPLAARLTVVALEPLTMWLVGSAFTYMVGATFFRGPETETDYAEVLRTTGFAFGPGLLFVLGAVPIDSIALAGALVGRLWLLAACVVAVRQALDFTTARAVGTYVAAAALMWFVLWGLAVAPVPG